MPLYEDSGLSKAPMFINYTPYLMDLSSGLDARDATLALAQNQAKEASDYRQKLMEMEIPGAEGAVSDQIEYSKRAMAALEAFRNPILEAGGNMWAVARQKKQRDAFANFVKEVSPTNRAMIKAEGLALEARLEAIKKDPGLGDVLATDINGNAILDKSDGRTPLTQAQFVAARNSDPRYSFAQNGATDYAQMGNKSSNKFIRELGTLFASVASSSTAWGGNTVEDENGNLVPNVVPSGYAGLLWAGTTEGMEQSNQRQLDAMLQSVMVGFGNDDRNAIFAAYSNTPEYRRRKANGDFLGRDGKFDLHKAIAIMQEEKNYGTTYGQTEVDAKGRLKPIKVSFAEKFVLDIAEAYLSEASKTLKSLDAVKTGKNMGENEASGAKYNWFEAQRLDPNKQFKGVDYNTFTPPVGTEGAFQENIVRNKTITASFDTEGNPIYRPLTYNTRIETLPERDMKQFAPMFLPNGAPVEPTGTTDASKEKQPAKTLTQALGRGSTIKLATGDIASTGLFDGSYVVDMSNQIEFYPNAIASPGIGNPSYDQEIPGFKKVKTDGGEGKGYRYEYDSAGQKTVDGGVYTSPWGRFTIAVPKKNLESSEVKVSVPDSMAGRYRFDETGKASHDKAVHEMLNKRFSELVGVEGVSVDWDELIGGDYADKLSNASRFSYEPNIKGITKGMALEFQKKVGGISSMSPAQQGWAATYPDDPIPESWGRDIFKALANEMLKSAKSKINFNALLSTQTNGWDQTSWQLFGEQLGMKSIDYKDLKDGDADKVQMKKVSAWEAFEDGWLGPQTETVTYNLDGTAREYVLIEVEAPVTRSQAMSTTMYTRRDVSNQPLGEQQQVGGFFSTDGQTADPEGAIDY